MVEQTWIGLLFAAMGLFSALGALLEWKFFMESRKARRLASWIGRDGARGFYTLLGVVFFGLGVAMVTGLLVFGP